MKATMTKTGNAVNIVEDKLGRGAWLPFYDGHTTVAFAQPYSQWMGTGPITGPCKVALFKSIVNNRDAVWTRREPGFAAEEAAMQSKRFGRVLFDRAKDTDALKHALNNPVEMEFAIAYTNVAIQQSVGMVRLPLPATVKALQEYSQFLSTVDVIHEVQVTPPRKTPENLKAPKSTQPERKLSGEFESTPHDEIWDLPKKSNASEMFGKSEIESATSEQENRTASFIFVDLEDLFATASLFPMQRIDVYHHDMSKWGSGNIFGMVNT
jgi:hypothetical protein